MSLDAYVGLPFMDGGRDRNGLDCWGLVRLVYFEVLGIDLPSYAGAYETTADLEATARLLAGRPEPWVEVPRAAVRPLDVVLMRQGRLETHVGVVAGRGQVLHVSPGASSVIEPYGSMRMRRRVARFVRYVG